MIFKINGESKRTMYHGKWIDDGSDASPFLLNYEGEGFYEAYKEDMTLYGHVNFKTIEEYLKEGKYKLVEKELKDDQG